MPGIFTSMKTIKIDQNGGKYTSPMDGMGKTLGGEPNEKKTIRQNMEIHPNAVQVSRMSSQAQDGTIGLPHWMLSFFGHPL